MSSHLDEGTEASSLLERLDVKLKGARHNENYDRVRVLLLFWETKAGVKAPYRDEGLELGRMFTQTFRYEVETIVIPFEDPQLFLDGRLAEEIRQLNKKTKRGKGKDLLILHYGGHGSNSNTEQRAVWAPDSNEASDQELVEWHEIQAKLERTEADILLLLDCCFGASAGRDRKRTARIEMITATAKREKTPPPGSKSWTHALISLLQRAVISEKGQISAEGLAKGLLAIEVGLPATSNHIVLREGHPPRSIQLRPLDDSQDEPSQPDLQGHCIRLIVRVSDLNSSRIDEIAAWLRTDVPPNTYLELENTLKKTEAVQALVKNVGASEEPLNKALGSDAMAEIAAAWNTISELIMKYQSTHQLYTGQKEFMKLLEEEARDFLRQLDQQNAALVGSIEQGILHAPCADKGTELEQIIEVPEIESVGIANQLRLRKMILATNNSNANGGDTELSVAPVHPRAQSVWHEVKKYGPHLNPADLPQVQRRISQMADLLKASKSTEFRSLKCNRWFHEPLQDQFVLEFDIPPAYRLEDGGCQYTTLKDVVLRARGSSRPTLGQRFKFALQVSQALNQWHSVGWVHQGVSAHNIMFFESGDRTIDFSNAFLQGFDFARPSLGPSLGQHVEDVNHDVYRHIHRQGDTRQGHIPQHDLYSLGVVLLEIGLWEDVCLTAGVKEGRQLEVTKMVTKLRAAAAKRLAHYMGEDYQEAVLACLDSDFGVELDDENRSLLRRAFQQRVLAKLQKSAALR